MLTRRLAIFLFVCFSFRNDLMAQEPIRIYVSPSGNDVGKGSLQTPFRTLERARKEVRKVLCSKNLKQPVLVYLRKGNYYLDSTFVLRAEDSGEPGSPVVYKAYPNEIPVISGSRRIKGWQKLKGDSPVIHPAVEDKIWVASIPKGWRFHYFYVNGKMRSRSQSDHRYWRFWNKDHKAGKPDSEGQIISYSRKETLKHLPSNGDAEMVCIMAQYGVMGNGVITDVDTAKGTLRWNSRQTNIRPSREASESGYCFENVPYFIDRPGDWAVDSEHGLVYYYPLPNEILAKETVTAPYLYELVRLEGDETTGKWVHDVEINGLELSYTDRLPENEWPRDWLMRQWENVDALVYLSGTLRCALKNNRILYSGSYGITMHHFAQQNTIEGNEIGYTGSGGIFLEGYGPGKLDVNRENIIERNYVHDHGLGNYWHSPCIQVYQSGHNRIAYNLLQRSAYSAISIVGIDPERMNDPLTSRPGFFDGQVQKWSIAQIRFTDFADSIQKGILDGRFQFDRETIKPYLHSNENTIAYNVISEPHSLLYEGGAIYAWSCGKGNVWKRNVIFKSAGMPGSSVLALDDRAEYTTVEENVFWIEGKILNGVGSRSSERGNQISNNYRINYKPEFSAESLKEKIGSWWINETGRGKMDTLLNKIQSVVDANGGWPGKPAIGIPNAGEAIQKYGTSEVLPAGSHVTIEE